MTLHVMRNERTGERLVADELQRLRLLNLEMGWHTAYRVDNTPDRPIECEHGHPHCAYYDRRCGDECE